MLVCKRAPVDLHIFDGAVEAVLTVLAAFAGATICAGHAALVTLAVLFEAARLATVATFGVEAAVLNLRLESVRVAILNRLHGELSLFITVMVGAVTAVAFWATPDSQGEAITVQLEALRLLAVAYGSASSRGDHN